MKLRPNLSCVGVLTNVGILCAVLVALPSHARATPEDDLAKFTARLRTVSESLAREPEKNAGALADIGIAQVRLRDLKGALKTLARIATGKQAYASEFVEQLASLQAATGDATGALKTVASVRWRAWHFNQARALLAVGRAAVRVGMKVEAKTAITRALATIARMHDCADQHIILFEIAMAQIEAGSLDEARKTFRVLERLTDKLNDEKQTQAHSLCRMGILSARLGDSKAAKRYFAAAIGAIHVGDDGGGEAHAMIAVAQADAGDFIGGTITALSIPGQVPLSWDRDGALRDIALLRLSRGDRARAEQTADEIRHSRDYHSAALLAISASYARAGEARKAIAVARGITVASRKAQALLDIAAIMAQGGDKHGARRLAEGITFLRSQDDLLRQLGREQRFVFGDPKTWGYPYESTDLFTMASYLADKDTAGDVTAAAMRCRVALDGHGGMIDRKVAEEWEVRKVAKAQAAARDARGVLVWMDRLPSAQQLLALLGAADGLGLVLDESARHRQKKE